MLPGPQSWLFRLSKGSLLKPLVTKQWWPGAQRLKSGFLLRLLLVRVFLIGLAVCTLDAVAAGLAAGRPTAASTPAADSSAASHSSNSDGSSGSPWGWRQRLGLLGLLVPLLSNSVGLLWPLLDIAGFERSYDAFNKGLMASCVVGKLLEVFSKVHVLQGSCQQSMLLHGVLFIVHQDPLQQYVQQLALMVLGYSSCHLWMTGGLRKGWQAAVNAAATAPGSSASNSNSSITGSAPGLVDGSRVVAMGFSQWNSSSSSILSLTTSGEFFINAFMLLLLLHHLYHAVVSARETPSSAKGSSSRSRRRSSTGAGASRPPPHGMVQPQPMQQPPPGQQQQQQPQKQQFAGCVLQVEEAPMLLNKAFLLKLAVVKLLNAVFVMLYSLQCWQHAGSKIAVYPFQGVAGFLTAWLPGWLSGPADLLSGLPVNPCLVGLLCAGVLCSQVATAFLFRRFYGLHARWINGVSFYTCLIGRMLLVGMHSFIHARGCSHPLQECIADGIGGVPPEHMFHSFLMLAFSLSAHEDALLPYTGQLIFLAVLYRHMHLVTVAAQGTAGAAALTLSPAYLLDLPEYYIMACVMFATYKWTCVGMFVKVEAAQPASVGSTAGSTAGSRPSSKPSSRRCSSTGQVLGSWQNGSAAHTAAAAAGGGVAVAGTSPMGHASVNGHLSSLPEAFSLEDNQAHTADSAPFSLPAGSILPMISSGMLNEQQQPAMPNSLQLHASESAAHLVAGREKVEGHADSLYQLQAALQTAQAEACSSMNSRLAPAAATGAAVDADSTAAGFWYIGPANSSTHEDLVERPVYRNASDSTSSFGTSDDLSHTVGAAAEQEEEEEEQQQAHEGVELDHHELSQQQQQQEEEEDQQPTLGFAPLASLAKWTREDLSRLKKDSFDISVTELKAYRGAAVSAQASDAAAAAAAAATAAAYCMASPGLQAAGLMSSPGVGSGLQRRFNSACDLQALQSGSAVHQSGLRGAGRAPRSGPLPLLRQRSRRPSLDARLAAAAAAAAQAYDLGYPRVRSGRRRSLPPLWDGLIGIHGVHGIQGYMNASPRRNSWFAVTPSSSVQVPTIWPEQQEQQEQQQQVLMTPGRKHQGLQQDPAAPKQQHAMHCKLQGNGNQLDQEDQQPQQQQQQVLQQQQSVGQQAEPQLPPAVCTAGAHPHVVHKSEPPSAGRTAATVAAAAPGTPPAEAEAPVHLSSMTSVPSAAFEPGAAAGAAAAAAASATAGTDDELAGGAPDSSITQQHALLLSQQWLVRDLLICIAEMPVQAACALQVLQGVVAAAAGHIRSLWQQHVPHVQLWGTSMRQVVISSLLVLLLAGTLFTQDSSAGGSNSSSSAAAAASPLWMRAAVQRILDRMDLQIITQTHAATVQTLSGVLFVGLAFLLVSGVQAVVMHSKWLRNPRQVWYESAKHHVLAFGERTLSLAVVKRGSRSEVDTETEALLDTLGDLVHSLFPGCSVVLTLLEEGTLDSGVAVQHIMPAAPPAAAAAAGAGAGGLTGLCYSNSTATGGISSSSSGGGGEQAPLMGTCFLPPVPVMINDVPSVQAVCQGRRLLFTSRFVPDTATSQPDSRTSSHLNFSDWRQLAESHGANCFLAVPLCFAQNDMGCLLLLAKQPAALDKYVRKLAVELGLVVAQTLYTLLCMQQLRAGDQIINDIMPEKVAEHLRRRVITTGVMSNSSSFGLSLNDVYADGEAQHHRQQQQQQQQLQGHLEQQGVQCQAGIPNSTPLVAQPVEQQQQQQLLLRQRAAAEAARGDVSPEAVAAADWHSEIGHTSAGSNTSGSSSLSVSVPHRRVHTRTARVPSPLSLNHSSSFHGSTPALAAVPGNGAPAHGASGSMNGSSSGQLDRGRLGLPSVAGPAAAAAAADGAAVAYKQWHPNVSVLFADICGYTLLSQQVEPEQVMLLLHQVFSRYDSLCTQYGIYKVETIGDCWMGATGLLADDPLHASRIVAFGRDMLAAAASVDSPLGGPVRIRVGVHSGRVMSGIIGSMRARYCLFGDTVNTASRMESTGVPGRVQISEETYVLLPPEQQAEFEQREAVPVKGKGTLRTYVLRQAAPPTPHDG